MNITEKISLYGLLPVIKLDDGEKALPLATALKEGGLPLMEITLRTPSALGSISKISKEIPDIILGAGTVTTIEQVKQATDSGASFIVSPGFNETTVDYCKKNNIIHFPGVSSASDIEKAINYGLDTLKFFPAENSGGIAMLKALAGPYGDIKFIPTGGVNGNNMVDYLSCKNVIACGGSFMVNEDDIKNSRFDNIKSATRKALAKMLDLSLGHMGINAGNDGAAQTASHLFCDIFGFDYLENNASVFSSTLVEIMKVPNYGKYGHIAVKTNFIKRAQFILEGKGVKFIPDSIKFNDKGEMAAIYLEDEILGFAVHLVQKPRG